MTKSFDLYRIDWIDAVADGGWKNAFSPKKPEDLMLFQRQTVHSVGWMIISNSKYVVLAQQLSSYGQYADTIQIPISLIKRKKKLTGNRIRYES